MQLKLWTKRVFYPCKDAAHDTCRLMAPYVEGWLDICACECHQPSEDDIASRMRKILT